jgi:hypothetical protein
MLNEVQETRIEAKIYTTRGEITIHCDGSSKARYRYRPLEKLDLYAFGPVDTLARIEERLLESWITPTQEIIAQVEAAIDMVERLSRG